WRSGERWGQQVLLPQRFDLNATGRDVRRPISVWAGLGVRTMDGRPLASSDTPAAIVLPDGPGGASADAFLVTGNFTAIRRYNPSAFSGILVGLLGDSVV